MVPIRFFSQWKRLFCLHPLQPPVGNEGKKHSSVVEKSGSETSGGKGIVVFHGRSIKSQWNKPPSGYFSSLLLRQQLPLIYLSSNAKLMSFLSRKPSNSLHSGSPWPSSSMPLCISPKDRQRGPSFLPPI